MYPTAYLALLLVVPVTAILFGALRPQHAAAIVMFGAMLFLPEGVGFDAPGLPPLDKGTLPPLVVLVALSIVAPRRLVPARDFLRSDWFIALMIVGAFATGMVNTDPVPRGSVVIPGLGTWDTFSDTFRVVSGLVAPYVVGRTQIRNSKDLRDFSAILVGASVVYLPLVYFELRMSPQLHYLTYGFQQHSFAQTVRYGGYRPMVFMSHGLTLAMFSFSAVIMAWAIARGGSRVFGALALPIASILTITHVLLKSSAAVVYAAVTLGLLFLAGKRTRSATAVLLCALVLTYPSARASGAFPTRTLVETAQKVSYERAASLDFRFLNEDVLLEKARERPWLGWGGWGRSRVYDGDGRDVSVTDGAWIITYGSYGAVGFVALFGLLTSASLTAARVLGQLRRADNLLLAALTWVQIFLVVNLIPNSMGSNLTPYLTGCVVGAAHCLVREVTRDRARGQPGRNARSTGQ